MRKERRTTEQQRQQQKNDDESLMRFLWFECNGVAPFQTGWIAPANNDE